MTRWTWLAIALAAGLATASVLVSTTPRAERPPPETTDAPTALTPTESDFYRNVAPRLSQASRDADTLVEIGRRRSRNLLEIRDAQDRMDQTMKGIDAALGRDTPPLFRPTLATYRGSTVAIREAMDEAQAGFLRFDWDRVAAAYKLAETGAADLRRAREELAVAAGVRVPVGTPPSTPR